MIPVHADKNAIDSLGLEKVSSDTSVCLEDMPQIFNHLRIIYS